MTNPSNNKYLAILLLVVVSIAFNSFGQSASATYNAGNIPTSLTSYSATCTGPSTTLVVSIPAGANVTGIDISYDFTATNSAWMSEQRSRVRCQETGNVEATVNGTGGDFGGTESYNRTGVNIANGISATGTLTFEMQAWRTWGGSACDQTYNYINNNSWTITVYYFIPGPMLYASSTATQTNTQTIQSCDGSAEIIGVEVQTTGSSPTINLTEMIINTGGTTNLSEISAVNVYYTGNSPVFAATNLLGTAAPGASVTISGVQSLQMGSNYFWIEYQLIPMMTIGNNFDAACSQITVNGSNYTPTITNPSGNRTVGACNPAPGGVSGNLQTWFDANSGTVGSPVTTWNNLGSNTNVTQITSSSGGSLSSNDLRSNYNNIVSTTGGYNGTFHAEVSNRTQVISGNEVTMYAAYQLANAPDLVYEFHGSTQTNATSNSANEWLSWGFRHAGLGSLFSNGTTHIYDNPTLSQSSQNSNFVGLHGTSGSSGGNSTNGTETTYGNIGNFHSGSNYMEMSIGYWPGYGMSRGVMEAILWDADLSASERNKVETYLAVKYGITMGINGTSMDYISPFDGSVVWDVSANTGFNFDIAGLMRSDISGLDQRKSHSTNGPVQGTYNDIVTMAHGTNFSTPSSIPSDGQALLWGHDNGALINTGIQVNYPTDNGETIEAIFTREWKSQEANNMGTVTIEFDLSSVIGIGGVLGANDLSFVRLLVDEDGNYAVGATSITPSSYDNTTGIVYFQLDFIPGTGNPLDQNRGYYFTIATTSLSTSPLPVTLGTFDVESEGCETYVSWSTVSEKDCDYFVIHRSYDMEEWIEVARVDGAQNSTEELYYAVVDREFNRNGAVYYRLTQVDIDGKTTVLGAKGIQAACENNVQPVIYPNPSSGQLNVFTAIAGTATLFDAQGRLLRKDILIQGENVLSLNQLASGTYTMAIFLENGNSYREQWIKL